MLFVSYSKYRLRCVMVYILYKHIGSEMSNIDNTNQVRNFISNLRAIAALRACALCVSLNTSTCKTGRCEQNPSSVHLGLCSDMERHDTLLTDILQCISRMLLSQQIDSSYSLIFYIK
jgi:hypothetical protein